MNSDLLAQLAQEIYDGEITIAELRAQKDGHARNSPRYKHLTQEIRRVEPAVSFLKRTFQAAVVRRLGEIAGVDSDTPPYDEAITKPVAAAIRSVASTNLIELHEPGEVRDE